MARGRSRPLLVSKPSRPERDKGKDAAGDRRAPNETFAYLLLILAALFWAGNYIVGRAIRDDIEPVALAFWRAVLAFAMALPFAFGQIRRSWPAVRAEWPTIAALGATGVGLYHACTYLALSGTTAINAAMFLSAMPIAIVAASWLALGHRVTRMQAAGMLLSLLGVLAVIVRGDPAALLTLRLNAGDLWMLAAVPLWAAYSVLLLRRRLALPPLALLTLTMGFGALFLLPLVAWSAALGHGLSLNLPGLLGVLYVALFASLLGYLFWNQGVAAVGPNRAGSFLHLTPIFSAGLAVLLLGEAVALYHMVGGALVFAGILLVSRGRAADH